MTWFLERRSALLCSLLGTAWVSVIACDDSSSNDPGVDDGSNLVTSSSGTDDEAVAATSTDSGPGGEETTGTTTGDLPMESDSETDELDETEGGEPEIDPEVLSLFMIQCQTCHGTSGEGVEFLGPEIRHPNFNHATYVIRNGDVNLRAGFTGAMLAYPESAVSEEELLGILTWLNDFPKPTTGARLFADYCANCHGADGRGGPDEYASEQHSAPFIRRGDDFLSFVRQGARPDEPEARNEHMPAFSTTVLTDAEIRLIEAWLPTS